MDGRCCQQQRSYSVVADGVELMQHLHLHLRMVVLVLGRGAGRGRGLAVLAVFFFVVILRLLGRTASSSQAEWTGCTGMLTVSSMHSRIMSRQCCRCHRRRRCRRCGR